jgi:DNA-binding IclR family transcriptional regulator
MAEATKLPADSSGRSAGSLLRAAKLLRAISRGGPNGASLMELVSWTDLPRPTIHRVLDLLRELGWIERDEQDGRYHLGRELFCLGLTAMLRHPVGRIAQTDVTTLVEETGQTVFVMIRTGNDALCVLREQGSIAFPSYLHEVGSRSALGIGAGSMAILAALPPAEASAVLAANRFRYRKLPAFNETGFALALREARRTGVAVQRGWFFADRTGIGAAVRDPGGYPIASVSIAALADGLTEADHDRLAAAMLRTSRAIAEKLSIHPPGLPTIA